MPCLNEAETLETCISKASWFLRENRLSGEIVVADNGSSDASIEIARKAGARVVDIRERGYGSAVLGGITAARAEFVIVGDADASYDFSDLAGFVKGLSEGADLVMGNRFAGGIMPGAMPFLHRYLGNPGLSWLARLFFRSPIRDFHCGLRGLRRSAILSLGLQTTGMEFASEMVVKATLRGLTIREVPTRLYRDGRTRRPHLRTWHDGWRHLKFLFLYSPRWLFLFPGILLTILGVFTSAVLISGPISLGGIVLDIATLLYAALLTVVGAQLVLFSLFTYVFGVRAGLLPPHPFTGRLVRAIRPDSGILLGTIGMLAGLAASFGSVIYWSQQGFGALDPSRSMRLAIPGAVLFALGLQFFFATFFIAILETKTVLADGLHEEAGTG